MLCDISVEKISMKNLYRYMTGKRKEIEKGVPINLYSKDFVDGTYLIDKPGYYVLKEDIVFNPNPNYDYRPRDDQVKYKLPGFVLGFFAVIAIYAYGVYLDLNGFTIKASKEFTLQQRFFSIIELANAPFVWSQGPANFSTATSFVPATNTIVRNGKLGLSSHHGIHGGMCSNILLEKLTIENFEFVGVALNGCHSILAHKVIIKNNRQDIPVLATYSAARFAVQFAKRVAVMSSVSSIQKVELSRRIGILQTEMDSTFKEIIATGKTTSKLFQNESGLADGNIYGFLVKNRGLAVDELVTPDPSVIKTKNVFLRKVHLENLVCRVDEILGLSQKGGLGIQVDTAGAVLQIDKIKDENGVYKGTSLSDVQLYLAELTAGLGIQIGKLNITADVVEWSKSGQSISTLLEKGYFFKTGSDSMGHLGKSSFGYRFDAIDNLILDKCSYYKIKNVACMGCDLPNCKMDDVSKRNGHYPGASATGLNLAYCSDVLIRNFQGRKVFSKDGDAIGIRAMFGTEGVKLDEVELRDIKGGTLYKGKWIGKSYSGKKVPYTDDLPNRRPQAVGIKYDNNAIIDMKDVEISDLKSCDQETKILKL
jgi:hypothetical protein